MINKTKFTDLCKVNRQEKHTIEKEKGLWEYREWCLKAISSVLTN